ncbi:hypothetical protein BX666DRAFT_1870713, partial [Dichotomocladium elegans]
DIDQLIKHSTKKGTNAMQLLWKIGAHQYGFGMGPALRIYCTFVQPVLEYSLAIAPLNADQTKLLETAQTTCIRLATNVVSRRPVPTIVQKHIADLPSMALQAAILAFKFVHRAHWQPRMTLLCAVIRSFLHVDNAESSSGERDAHWRTLTTGAALWQDYTNLAADPPLPRDPIAEFIINAHRDLELEVRREKFPAVAHACPTCMWDLILYLPATTRQRHQLVKWRVHWLPSFPPKDCRCGFRKAKRSHYLECTGFSRRSLPQNLVVHIDRLGFSFFFWLQIRIQILVFRFSSSFEIRMKHKWLASQNYSGVKGGEGRLTYSLD